MKAPRPLFRAEWARRPLGLPGAVGVLWPWLWLAKAEGRAVGKVLSWASWLMGRPPLVCWTVRRFEGRAGAKAWDKAVSRKIAAICDHRENSR